MRLGPQVYSVGSYVTLVIYGWAVYNLGCRSSCTMSSPTSSFDYTCGTLPTLRELRSFLRTHNLLFNEYFVVPRPDFVLELVTLLTVRSRFSRLKLERFEVPQVPPITPAERCRRRGYTGIYGCVVYSLGYIRLGRMQPWRQVPQVSPITPVERCRRRGHAGTSRGHT